MGEERGFSWVTLLVSRCVVIDTFCDFVIFEAFDGLSSFFLMNTFDSFSGSVVSKAFVLAFSGDSWF